MDVTVSGGREPFWGEMTAGEGVVEREAVGGFDAFFVVAEPRLRRALIARHGSERGREATVDALTYGWRHWDRVSAMDNPLGYLYRVGANSVRHVRVLVELDGDEGLVGAVGEPWVEPGLVAGLELLSDSQRVAVVLRHSFEWSLPEIAELLEVSVSSVRSHLERGMNKLRSALEVGDE